MGPIVGSILAAIIYNSIFVDDYIDEFEESRLEREKDQLELQNSENDSIKAM